MSESTAASQACPACGALVDVSEAEPLATLLCPACGAKMRAQKSFDHFLLVETLGVGGMGSVYKARDTRLDRLVALKLLRRELSADPVEAARLEQEARLTAAINHPNVVQVYSAGHAHGQIYLVMELVDHGSLDDLIAQHTRLPEAQVLQAGIEVAKGLQAAHEKGLIHRDVKPANILFTSAGTAKVGDFGLAVAAGQKAEAQNEIWGTPYYVAPERLNNEPEDFRSDIYSLGATLFHALAGRPPMEGETTSASELRRLKSQPPELRAFAPDVSRETARIISRTLASDPAGRFQSYAEFIRQLEMAAGASGGRRKIPAWVWGIVAVVVAAVIGGGIYLTLKENPAALFLLSPAPTAVATPDPQAALRRQEEAQRAADAGEKKKLAEESKARDSARQEAEKAAEERLLAQESPVWQKALNEARASIASYDFRSAFAVVDAAAVSAPSLVTARANEQKKLRWLQDWKQKLIADINAQHFVAPVEIANTAYTGAAKADANRITFRLPPYGTAEIEWIKLRPPVLLAMSTSLIKPGAADTAERQWLAAVFAAETGQTEAAHGLAETASKAKPEYREELGSLF